MRASLEASLTYVTVDEGPGSSARRYGVTQAVLSLAEFRECGDDDVAKLSLEECKDALCLGIWEPLQCDVMPRGVDYFLFDCGVMCGNTAARRWLELVIAQRGNFANTPGGGSELLRDADGCRAIVEALEFLRRRRHKADTKWNIYSSVWTNRCNRAKQRALKMIGGSTSCMEDACVTK